MKKAIALLVAITTIFGVGMIAYADGGIVMPRNSSGSAYNIDWGTGADGTDYLTIGASEMFLVWADGDHKDEVVTPDTVLRPGHDYTFRIFKSQNSVSLSEQATAKDFISKAGGTIVTKADLAGGKLRVRSKGGTGSASAKIDDRGSGANTRYNLEVTTRTQYGTKLTDVEYSLTVSGGNSSLENSTTALRVGFQKMDDDDIDGYAEDDIITIYNEKPVITSKQFQRLAKNYNYKPITFENEEGSWTFTARVSGNGDANFYNTEEIVEELIAKLPEQNYKFFNFHSGVKFATNGEMRLDVSDINTEFNRMHLYLYRNGQLTPVTTTYDSHSSELVFRTNYLGTFVVTDAEITDTNIIGGEEKPVEPEQPPTEGGNNNNNNANTGNGAAMNVLMTLGLAAISGGTFIRKRK